MVCTSAARLGGGSAAGLWRQAAPSPPPRPPRPPAGDPPALGSMALPRWATSISFWSGKKTRVVAAEAWKARKNWRMNCIE